MRHAIFGDIHGNLDALEAVLADIQHQDVDRLYCLGDIVGYGAQPAECLERIRNLRCQTVAGNHDRGITDSRSAAEFNAHAKAALDWTRDKISESDFAWLADLPLIMHLDSFSIVHASLSWPSLFTYIFTPQDAQRCMHSMEKGICFFGHTHVPAIFSSTGTDELPASQFKFPEPVGVKGKMIANPGSVGQPRDCDPRAAYCIFDDVTSRIAFRRLDYPISSAARKIREAGLPDMLAWRLESGR